MSKKKTHDTVTFIKSVLYNNPIWDLGFQHELITVDPDKVYQTQKKSAIKFTRQCICPCSHKFDQWHINTGLNKISDFTPCKTEHFLNPYELLQHVYLNKADFYHRIILRIIQTNYSSLVVCFDMSKKGKQHIISSFQSKHDGKVTLLEPVVSSLPFTTHIIKRDKVEIILARTNLLSPDRYTTYTSHLSQSSFQKTLKDLTKVGYHNKTKKGNALCIVSVVQ